MTKEQPWANRSGCSWQKSDREQFTQVAHDKRANELISRFFSLFHSQKTSDSLNFFSNIVFFVCFFYKVLKVLKINKRFAYFLLLKSDLSKSLRSLRSLTKNEWTSESLIYFEGIAPSLIFCKKRVIRVENRWSNSQPWSDGMRIQNPSQTCTWPTCSVLVILRHQTLKNI